MSNSAMYVTKRNGTQELVKFDKITDRIRKLLNENEVNKVDPIIVTQKVVSTIYSGITTAELDFQSANICVNMSTVNPFYSNLAGRLLISNLHKITTNHFVDKMVRIQTSLGFLDEKWLNWIKKNKKEINGMIDYERDYIFDYFGFKTLERAYLMKIKNEIIERPQDMFMRVASFLNQGDLENTKKTYDLISSGFYTHATPTLFNSANKRSQLSSCFEGNTTVNTLRGPIPIKDIKIGDKVITHLGNAKKVLQIHKNLINERKLYKVDIRKTNKFIATENHKLFVLNKKTLNESWKEIENLDTDDYIMIPNYKGTKIEDEIDVFDVVKTYNFENCKNTMTIEQDQHTINIRTGWTSNHLNGGQEIHLHKDSTPINKKILVNNDFMKLVGIWYGDGHIMTSINKNNKDCVIRGIGFTIHKDNQKLIDFCINMKNHFGLEHATIHKMTKQNVIQVLYNCPVLGILFQQLYGKGFNGKRLNPSIYDYDTSLVLSFMTGLVTTDGCVSAEGIITLALANKELMEQIYSLCRIHNLDVSSVNIVKMGKLAKTQAYTINLSNLRYDLGEIWKTYKDKRLDKLKKSTNARNQSSPIINEAGFKFLHFEGKEEVKIDDEYVYTLGVEDDHSYSISGIIAQNCFLIGTDDCIEGITHTWDSVAKISKWGGGIGLHVSNIRAKDSLIKGTNGPSSGIIPMLKVYNEIARYIDQCFVGETKVYTEKGLVAIEDIKPKDKVYTKDGTLQEVTRVYCDNFDNEALNIKIMHDYESIKVTPKHPFWVIKNSNEGEWIEAEDITTDDLIAFAIPNHSNDNPNLDESDCYMYGLLISAKEPELILKEVEFVKNYLDQHSIQYSIESNKIKWNFSSKFKFVKSQLKSIDYNMLNLPIEKAKWIIAGLLESGNSINKEAMDAIKYILLRMGILISGYTRETGMLKIPKVKELAEILQNSEILDSSPIEYIKQDGFLYTRIKEITREKINESVYDLEVANNHNYLTQAGLVHNGGKRRGSIAIYLEPWHPDIMAFLELKKNFGAETERARDLFLAVWLPDLFMKRVDEDGDWYLMCPNECPGLPDVWGDDFEKLYNKYIAEGKFRLKIEARKIMKSILDSQLETGTPYVLYKDTCNRKSNQQNIGTIKSSNLCAEVLLFSDHKEYAVCNLASIAVNTFVKKFEQKDPFTIYYKPNCRNSKFCTQILKYNNYKFEEKNGIIEKGLTAQLPQVYYGETLIGGFPELYKFIRATFDYEKLEDVAYTSARNLDRVIDVNYYPTPETKLSNMKHRPIGVGIQGLADALVMLKIPFDTEEAISFNSRFMESIYYGCVKASMEIAKARHEKMRILIDAKVNVPEFYMTTHTIQDKELNKLYHEMCPHKYEIERTTLFPGTYSTFDGSPFSKGVLQFDMWNVKPSMTEKWDNLKKDIAIYGVRNSQLTALMPTATTSQILGNNECFEFFTNNIYNRRTLAGDFILVNEYLVEDLITLGIWSPDIKDLIISYNGSIAEINVIPDIIKKLYPTIWEIKQSWVLKNAVARGPYVDQTQSMNIFMPVPDYQKLYSSHMWSWKNGLKTGIYYLRSKPAQEATKFTVDPNIQKMNVQLDNDLSKPNDKRFKKPEGDEICESCSS